MTAMATNDSHPARIEPEDDSIAPPKVRLESLLHSDLSFWTLFDVAIDN